MPETREKLESVVRVLHDNGYQVLGYDSIGDAVAAAIRNLRAEVARISVKALQETKIVREEARVEIERMRGLLLAVWGGDASEEQQAEVTRISVEASQKSGEEEAASEETKIVAENVDGDPETTELENAENLLSFLSEEPAHTISGVPASCIDLILREIDRLRAVADENVDGEARLEEHPEPTELESAEGSLRFSSERPLIDGVSASEVRLVLRELDRLRAEAEGRP